MLLTWIHSRGGKGKGIDKGMGKGRRAGLNFGDRLSYAIAMAAGTPLLFKGEDFRHADIEPALRT